MDKLESNNNRAPVIVVMPLMTGPNTSAGSHIGVGFRFELVSALVRFREWIVVDIASENQIGALQAHQRPSYQLELVAIEDEKNFSLAVKLTDYLTGAQVWGDRWRNENKNWVEMQHHVVSRLAVAMNLSLSHVRLQKLHKRNTQYSLSAYDSWLVAQESLLRFTPQSWEKAATLLRGLTRSVPTFPRTYSTLSQMENLRHLSLPGNYNTDKTRRLASDYALESVRLDPLDSRAQLCLGWSYAMDKDFDNAILTFERASELNEHDSWAVLSSGVGLAFSGEIRKARRLSNRASKLQFLPTPAYWSYQAAIKFLVGDYKGCVSDSLLAEEITVDVPAWHAAALVQLGDKNGATRVYGRFTEIVKNRWRPGQKPENYDITKWLSQCFPIKYAEERNKLLDSLNTLGLNAKP